MSATKTKIPKTGTKAGNDFYKSWQEINQLLHFVISLVGQVEFVANTAHEALMGGSMDEVEAKRLEDDWESRKGNRPIDELERNRQLLLEIVLVRHVENYLNYLSSLLFEIFVARPETLKSSDKVELSKVLEHESIDSLIRSLAEQKVESLSYSSFAKLAGYFVDRFNLRLADDEQAPEFTKFAEIRNISVHNRCIINSRYISRLGESDHLAGKKKLLSIEDIYKLVPLLLDMVKSLDSSARKKMRIKGVRFAGD